MGYYVETPGHVHGKAFIIVKENNGKIIPAPYSYDGIPADKGLIVVVDNGMFEAAGFCYNEEEFKVFTDPRDYRHKQYVLINREDAEILSGYRK